MHDGEEMRKTSARQIFTGTALRCVIWWSLALSTTFASHQLLRINNIVIINMYCVQCSGFSIQCSLLLDGTPQHMVCVCDVCCAGGFLVCVFANGSTEHTQTSTNSADTPASHVPHTINDTITTTNFENEINSILVSRIESCRCHHRSK